MSFRKGNQNGRTASNQRTYGNFYGEDKRAFDVNTIIGDPITSPDGTIIIPVSKVSFGFVAGGSDLPTKAPKEVFAGGSGQASR